MDTTKTIIRSILTASPNAMTVQQLCKEYINTIGEPITYQKFGFNSLEHFLRSIPDTIQLQGSGSLARVNLVASNKSSHLIELVSRQKADRKKGYRYPVSRRTIIPPQRDILEKYVPPQMRPASQKIVYPPVKPMNSLTTSSTSNSITNYSVHKKIDNTQQTKSTLNYSFEKLNINAESNNRVVTLASPNVEPHILPVQGQDTSQSPNLKPLMFPMHCQDTLQPSNAQPLMFPAHCQNTLQSPNVKSIIFPRHEDNNNNRNLNFSTQTSNLPVEKNSNNVTAIQKLNRSHIPTNKFFERNNLHDEPNNCNNTPKVTRDTALPNDHSEEYVPVSVKNNLKTLIGQHPEGIWCAEVPSVYRKMFKRELKYHDLGFRTLIELCTCLKSVFHYARPGNEDFILYDRSKPLPDCAEKTFTIASYTNDKSKKDFSSSALPLFEWTEVLSFLPPGVFKPGQEIPRTFVPETTQENDTFEIMVGEVYDASKFWVYDNDGQLDKLMDDMQVFYDQHSEKYAVPQELIKVGLYCVCIIFGEYHRALVVDVKASASDEIRLFYIDYGTIKRDKTNLYFLHEEFSKLPAQTIRCRLADIRPPEKGMPWTKESSEEFKALIKKRDMVAKISRINWKEQYLEIFLADVTDSTNVYYINDILVTKGHAVYLDQEQKISIVDSKSIPIVKQIHLFPTFMEIEHGLAPSASEMDTYYAFNIPINFCYPQYFQTNYNEEQHIIDAVTHFFETNVLKGLRNDIRHISIDIDKLKDKPIDMSHFKNLEEEIKEYWTNHESGQYYEEDACGIDETVMVDNTPSFSEDIEILTLDTHDNMKEHYRITEDIMNIISSLNNVSKSEISTDSDYIVRDTERLSQENDSLVFRKPDSINENTNVLFSDEESVKSFDTHPLNYLSFSRSNSQSCLRYESDSSPDLLIDCGKFDEVSKETLNPFINKTDDYEDNLEILKSPYLFDTNENDDDYYSEEVVSNEEETCLDLNPDISSTNPFMTNMLKNTEDSEMDIVGNNGRLHSNNPFLSYTLDNKDGNSDEASDSTVSTYGTCIEEIKIQRTWSTADHVTINNLIPNCSSSDLQQSTSCNQPTVEENFADLLPLSTTPNEVGQSASVAVTSYVDDSKVYNESNIKIAPETVNSQFDVTIPEFYPQNYYLPTQPITPLTQYNYFPRPIHLPPVMPYFRQQNQMFMTARVMQQTTSSSVCPPPGFAPNSNYYQRNNDAMDFYDAYNEMLMRKFNF